MSKQFYLKYFVVLKLIWFQFYSFLNEFVSVVVQSIMSVINIPMIFLYWYHVVNDYSLFGRYKYHRTNRNNKGAE